MYRRDSGSTPRFLKPCASDLDDMLKRGDVADGGEHRDVLEAFRMFAYDRGWLHKMREAVTTGLTAEAAVERVQSDTRARMMRQTILTCANACTTLTIWLTACCGSSLDKTTRRRGSSFPKTRSSSRATWGPAALLDYDVRACAPRARRRRHDLARDHRSPRLSASPRSPARKCRESGRHGDAIIVDGVSGEVQIRPAADIENPPMPKKARFRARRQAQYRALRNKPCVHARRRAHQLVA